MSSSETILERELKRADLLNAADLERGRRNVVKPRRGRKSGIPSGGYSRAARTRRSRESKAPKTASQFRFNHSYSRRNGKNGAPTNSLWKIVYDFDLGNKDFGRPEETRVAYTYACAKSGTPESALNPLLVAKKCLLSERRIDGRMMSHDTISIPSELDAAQRETLARKISQAISEAMDGVPVFTVLHEPDSGQNENNFHLHVSYPTREIVPLENGDFDFGQKILFESQPARRQEAGLEKTNHGDLKKLRGAIAGLCADALKQVDNIEPFEIERWRWGHLPLNGLEGDTQVKRAAARGDVEFVNENERREKQKHEGPGTLRLDGPSPTATRNEQLSANDPLLILQKKAALLIHTAAQNGCLSWEEFRQLALDEFSVSLEFNQTKSTGRVSGLRWRQGDLKCSGKEISLSLNQLKNELVKNGMSFASTNPEYAPPLKLTPQKLQTDHDQENDMPRQQEKQKLSPTIPELRKMVADAAAAAQAAKGLSGGTPDPVSAAAPTKPDLAKIMQSLANVPSATKPASAAPTVNKTDANLPPLSEYERGVLGWAWINRSHRGRELREQVIKYERLLEDLHKKLKEIESNEPPVFDSWLQKIKGQESTEHQKWESTRKSFNARIARFSEQRTRPELKSSGMLTPSDHDEIMYRELLNDFRWREWLKRYLEYKKQASQLDAIARYDRLREQARNDEFGAKYKFERLIEELEKQYPRLIEKHEFFLRCLSADPDALEFDPASILDDPLSPDEADALEQIRSGNTKYSTREYPQLIALHEQELKQMREQRYLEEFYQKPILERESREQKTREATANARRRRTPRQRG